MEKQSKLSESSEPLPPSSRFPLFDSLLKTDSLQLNGLESMLENLTCQTTNLPDFTESSTSVSKVSTPQSLKGKSVPEQIDEPYSKESVRELAADHETHLRIQRSLEKARREYDEAVRKEIPVLNPADPFDKVIIDIVNMNRKKRSDYAADGDIFSNFRDTAHNLGLEGFGPAEAAATLLLTKVARLRSLRINGRMADPANEPVLDSYLDLAVYAIIVLALVKEEQLGRPDMDDDWEVD